MRGAALEVMAAEHRDLRCMGFSNINVVAGNREDDVDQTFRSVDVEG